jgi:NTE family protein
LLLVSRQKHKKNYTPKKISSASVNAAVFGVPEMFIPRWWEWDGAYKDKEIYFDPKGWTCLYDHSPLAKTLSDTSTIRNIILLQHKENYQKLFGL